MPSLTDSFENVPDIDEFCIKNDELFTNNDGICAKNGEFCTKSDEFCTKTMMDFEIQHDEFQRSFETVHDIMQGFEEIMSDNMKHAIGTCIFFSFKNHNFQKS